MIMMVNTNNLVSITEANQNFSKVARHHSKSGRPKWMRETTTQGPSWPFFVIDNDRTWLNVFDTDPGLRNT